jgi:superfamily II DNA or RNA helicase
MAERAGINCGEIYGFMDKQGRKRQLERLSCGNMSVLFGTFALAKEGLDIPELRTLVMATPQKNDSLVTQAAGRVARKCEGKSCGKIIDFVDVKFGMLAGWKKKRATIYRKLGFDISESENAQISF